MGTNTPLPNGSQSPVEKSKVDLSETRVSLILKGLDVYEGGQYRGPVVGTLFKSNTIPLRVC